LFGFVIVVDPLLWEMSIENVIVVLLKIHACHLHANRESYVYSTEN